MPLLSPSPISLPFSSQCFLGTITIQMLQSSVSRFALSKRQPRGAQCTHSLDSDCSCCFLLQIHPVYKPMIILSPTKAAETGWVSIWVPDDLVKLTHKTDRQAEDGSGDRPPGKCPDGQAEGEPTLAITPAHHGLSRSSPEHHHSLHLRLTGGFLWDR